MHQFLLSLVSVFFVLGVLVFVHEFGHFAVAKLCRVRVEVFSLGFGKRLLGFSRGGTDYRISAIPLGGYVKMAGENPTEDLKGSPDEFSSHPKWQRFLIAIAGPAMNILLAIAILTGLYMWRFPQDMSLKTAPVIGYVTETNPDAPGIKAGMQNGDRIVSVDRVATNTWDDVYNRFMLSSGQSVEILLDRNGKQIATTFVVPQGDRTDVDLQTLMGVWPAVPLTVNQIEQDKPAYRAGLRLGDEIVGIDDVRPHAVQAVKEHIQRGKTNPIQLTVKRGDHEETFTITPVLVEDDNSYRIGFGSRLVKEEKLPFLKAFRQSLLENQKTSVLIVEFLQRMIGGKGNLRQMNSIVMIAKVSGEAAKEGWEVLLMLMASISVNLGIFNLLPIPILDGGVILLLMVEGVMRRELNRQFKERIYQAAFVFLLLFAVVVIFSDIWKLTFAHKM